MRVGILTNMDAKCGNAEYARDLAFYLRKHDVDVDMAVHLMWLQEADVIVINWHPAVVRITAEDIARLKSNGRKVVLILQNSFDWEFRVSEDDIVKTANAVIAHEPMNGNAEIHYIPHGIPEVDELGKPGEKMIGTAGFPFAWKRFDLVASVAQELDVKCRMIAPIYEGVDTSRSIGLIERRMGPQVEIVREWLPTADVVRRLSECTLNIFWFQSQGIDDQLGQTGSARLGVAARRPMIISSHRKFRTLWPYADELYVATTEIDVKNAAREILDSPETVKVPKRVLEDMGWNTVVKKYIALMESL